MKIISQTTFVYVLLLLTVQSYATIPVSYRSATTRDFSSFGVYAYGGYGIGIMRVGSFKDFAETYNSYYGPGGQDILDSELKPFRFCAGYMFGGGIRLGSMTISLSYAQMKSESEVEIKGGNQRIFTHVLRIPARIGIGFSNPYILAEFTTGLATPYLMAGYQYADGTISYGRERSLNGIYQSIAFTYGLNVAGKLPIAKVFAITAGFAVDGFSGFEYEDVNWNKIFNSSGSYSQYFPSDAAAWAPNPAAYPIEEAARAGGFSLYIWAGLTIQIPE